MAFLSGSRLSSALCVALALSACSATPDDEAITRRDAGPPEEEPESADPGSDDEPSEDGADPNDARRRRDAGARSPSLRDAGTRPDGASAPPPVEGEVEGGAPTLGTNDRTFPRLGTLDVDVAHYDLALRWAPTTGSLRAEARIDLTTRRALDAVALDFGEKLAVSEVEVSIDGAPARTVEAEQRDQKLHVTLPEPVAADSALALTIAYAGKPEAIQSESAPIPTGWVVHAPSNVVGTLSEPDAAHTWFPANDHPTDKATFAMAITVPKGQVAVGSGVEEGEPVDNADGTVTYRWRMDAPMAPYLALVAVDAFKLFDQGTVGGVRLRSYLPAQSADYERALAAQPMMLTRLVEQLGPYPFREYGAVVVPGRAVALETQGRSLFQGSSARDQTIIVHELAHQWMGDSVSVTSWARDIWWVEGFARYSEWLWIEQQEGARAYAERVQSAYRGLQSGPRVSLATPSVSQLFALAVYDGGALVFHQLRKRLGDAAFFRAMRTFCERYRHENASTEQLLAVFSEVSGSDVTPLVKAWFTTGPLPALSL